MEFDILAEDRNSKIGLKIPVKKLCILLNLTIRRFLLLYTFRLLLDNIIWMKIFNKAQCHKYVKSHQR